VHDFPISKKLAGHLDSKFFHVHIFDENHFSEKGRNPILHKLAGVHCDTKYVENGIQFGQRIPGCTRPQPLHTLRAAGDHPWTGLMTCLETAACRFSLLLIK
jgi:hypothetical protein